MTGKLNINTDYITESIAPSKTVYYDCFGKRFFYGIKSVFNRIDRYMLDCSGNRILKKDDEFI